MGTKQSSSEYSFLYSQWLFIERNQRFDVYKQLRNNLQVEVYSLNYLSNQNLQLFDRRKINRHPNVVQLIHYEILSEKDHYFCGKDTFGKIIIERTPFELKEYKRFANKSIENIIQQTFRGYQAIYEWYGPLRVQYGMIRFNNQGIIKVWINTNFSANEIAKQNLNFDGSEDFVVESILKIFVQIDNTIQICKKVRGFNEGLKQLRNKCLIRFAQKKKKIAKNIINNCIKFPTNPQQQQKSNIESKSFMNPSNQTMIANNNRFLNKNSSFIFQKKNASFTQAVNIPKSGIYIGRPSSNIPQSNFNNANNNCNTNSYRPSQYMPRKAINSNLILQRSPPHTVTTLNIKNDYNSLNTPKSSFNLSLNLNTPIKRQLSLKDENSINSHTYKKQIVTPVCLEQNVEQLSKLQQQQTPRLGNSSNKTKFAFYSEQENHKTKNQKSLSPNIYQNQINNNQISSLIKNNTNNNSNLPHQITLQQLKQDFLKKNKSIFNKLETIEMILQNHPWPFIKNFCILFKHALTIDREMYQQLQRINCQFDKIQNPEINQRIQKILSFDQNNNSNMPSNMIKPSNTQINFYATLPEYNFNNAKNQFRTNSGNRVESKGVISDKSKKNQTNNLFLPGLGVEQVQSILDSNREIQNIEQKNGQHNRNQSHTEKLIPNQQQEYQRLYQKEKQKRINTQHKQSSKQLNIEQKYISKPKQQISEKIKFILAEERKKRIQKGLIQTPKEFNIKKKNQERMSSKTVLFDESNTNKYEKVSTGSINSNYVASVYNSNYNSGESSNNIDNIAITPNKIEIPIIKDIQKIGRKKSKEISFGKNKFQDADNTKQSSNKQKVSYQDLRNDMQNLLKNSSQKIESKIKSQNEAIEEKLKQKKKQFCKIKVRGSISTWALIIQFSSINLLLIYI